MSVPATHTGLVQPVASVLRVGGARTATQSDALVTVMETTVSAAVRESASASSGGKGKAVRWPRVPTTAVVMGSVTMECAYALAIGEGKTAAKRPALINAVVMELAMTKHARVKMDLKARTAAWFPVQDRAVTVTETECAITPMASACVAPASLVRLAS
jgi:hypothetical protein